MNNMQKRFIEKFNTGKYKIGSFDSYQDETLELIKQNYICHLL